MNKLPVIFIALVGVAVFGVVACPSGGATSCKSDADCASDATNPICDSGGTNPTNVCIPAACTVDAAGNAECAVSDAGGDAACSADSDCDGCDDQDTTHPCACLQGANSTNHCVITQETTDPACDAQAGGSQLSGTDADGNTSVNFCDTNAPTCSAPGKCG